jgi:membrane protein required for colicin V production
MLIDIIFFILIVIAIFKGYRKGFVVAIFSFIALFVGLAAALKLSAFVANRLKTSVNVSSGWLPFLSFLVVFIIAVLLVNWGGKLIQKVFEMVLLGWVNRIAGIILYALVYTIIYSVFLFYAEKIHLFSTTTFQSSQTWPVIKPLGPKVIDAFGKILPVFKNMFKELEDFFAGLPQKVST